MQVIKDKTYQGERPLFGIEETELHHVTINQGESSLKKVNHINISKSEFNGKYPIWQASDIEVDDSVFNDGARAAIWYTNRISMKNSTVIAPKMFRDCKNVFVQNTKFDSDDAIWDTKGVTLYDMKSTGQYLLLHSSDIEMDNVHHVGNYSIQHVKNVVVRNSELTSKDLFWNSENVTVYDSVLHAEYLGWYSKNMTLVNCKIYGSQPLCYIENLKMINCEMIDADLAFEESTVDVEVVSDIVSVKNPNGGIIKAKHIGEFIDNYSSEVQIQITG